MATKEFKLPDVGEGVAEGELVSWFVSPGDTVTEDQPVAEVETDKALVEVPSPYNGTVKELLAKEGEMVPVGDVIITFSVGEEGDGSAEAAEETDADDSGAVTAEETADADVGSTETETPSGRVFAPPSVRRLARELGVDLASVSGSGPSGRITEGDVRAAAEEAEADEDAPKPKSFEPSGKSAVSKDGETVSGAGLASRSGSDTSVGEPADVEAAGRDRTLAAPATRQLAEELDVDLDDVPTDETRDGEPFVTPEAVEAYADAVTAAKQADAAGATAEGVRDRIPYRGVRRTIGEQMERSKYTAPHVTHHDTVVVDNLVETRAELKSAAEARDVRLTYMPFVLKAIVAAMKEFPILNSTLDEEAEEIVLKDEYNIGIAVATDAGLMVPVVKDVDQKSILELGAEIADLATRARDRKVSVEEMRGGTFTVTNFGAIGGEYATPIINYPETAILGLGAIEKRPVVHDDEVVPAHTLPLSLSIDHRVIDGAEAGAFTNELMRYLQNPSLLLLEA